MRSERFKLDIEKLTVRRNEILDRLRNTVLPSEAAKLSDSLKDVLEQAVYVTRCLEMALADEEKERKWQEEQLAKLDKYNYNHIEQATSIRWGLPVFWGDHVICHPDCTVCDGCGTIVYDEDTASPCPRLLLDIAECGMQHPTVKAIKVKGQPALCPVKDCPSEARPGNTTCEAHKDWYRCDTCPIFIDTAEAMGIPDRDFGRLIVCDTCYGCEEE